ncbi:hypothetical protein G7Z17_g12479 [Cylindrodendrum hubeiense]|uniref:Uncharacterized protein n=1 Tax=Cylindrodendrum hubeiense TaxID=595255 RepID=A0A9P5GVF8_9HYPO|nr:hypothetical protein G7Z17_g12479 [Cylindrodendrum hubeiense]
MRPRIMQTHRSDEPGRLAGGSTQVLPSIPISIEVCMRQGSTEHQSKDPAILKRYRDYMKCQWGFDNWPPDNWFGWAGQEKGNVTDADVCNICAMTIIALHYPQKMDSPAELYKRCTYGFIHAAATPGGLKIPNWKPSTSQEALKLMREHFAADLAAQPKTPPSRRGLPDAPRSQNTTPDNSRTHLDPITPPNSGQKRFGSSREGANSSGIRPDHNEVVGLDTGERALVQLDDSNHLLDVDVVNLLQHTCQATAKSDINLIHPEYFKSLYAPNPSKPWDDETLNNVINEIQEKEESLSAIYHTWGQGHWTFVRIRPNTKSNTITVHHYDPGPPHEASKRIKDLKLFFQSWTKSNFSTRKLIWRALKGPRHFSSNQSGIYVMLAFMDCLHNKETLSDSWGPSRRSYLKDLVTGFGEQVTLLGHESPGRLQSVRDGNPQNEGSPQGDSLQLNDSPLSQDSGVFCDSNNSVLEASPIEGLKTIRSSSPVEQPTNDLRGSKRPRSPTFSFPGDQIEGPEPPRKRKFSRALDDSALKDIQGMIPALKQFKEIVSRVDLSELATTALTAAHELEHQIEKFDIILEKQDKLHDKASRELVTAEQSEVALDSLRERYLGGRPAISTEIQGECRDAVVEVLDDAMVAVECVIIDKTNVQKERITEAKEAMRQAKAKGDRAQHDADAERQSLNEAEDYMLVIAQFMALKNPAEEFGKALEQGFGIGKGSGARSALVRHQLGITG